MTHPHSAPAGTRHRNSHPAHSPGVAMEIFQGCIQCLKILGESSCIFPSLIPFSVPLKTVPVSTPRTCPSMLHPSSALSVQGQQGCGMSPSAQVRVKGGHVASLPPCCHGETRQGSPELSGRAKPFPQPPEVSVPGWGGPGAATLSREIFITQQFSLKIRKWILLFVFMRLLEAGP